MDSPNRRSDFGFTLVELMVSTAILALILVIMVQLTTQTSNTWIYTTDKIEQFREAREAYETMVRRIGQATLNTYWDYDNLNDPKTYQRQSDLRFVSGPMQNGTKKLDSNSTPVRPTHGIFFQAPFGFVAPVKDGDTSWTNFRGLESALNTWGYFIEVNDDSRLRPDFLNANLAPLRVRSRLIEMMQPTGAMNVYQYTSGTPTGNPATLKAYAGFEWFRSGLASTNARTEELLVCHPLAENIVALAILPRLSDRDAQQLGVSKDDRANVLAPNYYYHSGETGEGGKYPPGSLLAGGLNSKHQLPPVVQVTMVAIDERSAQRLATKDLATDPLELSTPDFLTKATNLQRDLLSNPNGGASGNSLEKRMIDAGLNYRIFTSNVVIRGAKWSVEQSN